VLKDLWLSKSTRTDSYSGKNTPQFTESAAGGLEGSPGVGHGRPKALTPLTEMGLSRVP
jgi:hypothetical protein